MSYVMYCIVSREALKKMNGNRGKMVAQAGHAYLHAYMDAYTRFTYDAVNYLCGQKGATKVALVVDTDQELRDLRETYKDTCGVSLVVDAGKTCFDGQPTITCLGLGPIDREVVGEDLKALKVLI